MNDSKNDNRPARRPGPALVTGGRDPTAYHGFVNPPVYHASTVLYRTAADYVAHRSRYQYGRRGTPTTEALELALQELEGPQCAGVALLPSGPGGDLDRVAVGRCMPATTCWSPTASIGRRAISATRSSSGSASTTTYYDPLIGAGIAALMQAEHARGLRRIAGLAELRDAGHPGHRRRRARTGRARADGQYLGEPALLPRRSTTASISSIQAGTKYIGGHSDVMLGTVSANATALARTSKTRSGYNGLCVGPDDVYLALRGLRTLAVRLDAPP